MKKILIWLIIILLSCNPNFQHPHYAKRIQHRNGWKRKRVVIYKQDKYRNPIVKPETKREMVKPKTINLDKW